MYFFDLNVDLYATDLPQTVVISVCFMHRQPKLNIREPLNYKDLYGNATDLCKMIETNIVLSIKSTIST